MDQSFAIKCLRHPQRSCQVFTSQISSPCCLLCVECLQEESLDHLSLVAIEDILDENNKGILKNWPPLGTNAKQIFKNIKNISSSSNCQDLESEAINFFDRVEKNLVESVRKKKKEVLKLIASFSSNSEQLIKEYQQIAQIQQLKVTLTSSSDSKEVEKNVRTIITEYANNSEINSEKLLSKINLCNIPSSLNLKEVEQALSQFTETFSSLQLLPIPNKVSMESTKKESLINFSPEIQQYENKNVLVSGYYQNDSQFFTKTFLQSRSQNDYAYYQMIDSIKSEKKYILKLQFINHNTFASQANLIPLNQDINNQDYQIQFIHYGKSPSSNVIKGKEIWSDSHYRNKGQQRQKKIAEVEMRICIKDNHIVVIDRSSYQNAIKISSRSPDKFIVNSDYKLQLSVFQKNDSITLEEFREVSNFPQI